jgi:tetratricopeptide (TPR) repeat protein
LFLLLLVVVVGPCAAVQAPREVGRWKLAAAVKLRSTGNKREAYAKLGETMRWFPDNPWLYFQRAQWRLDDGQREEALADADRALELGGQELVWLQLHAQFLWSAGEFGRAVADWKQIDAQSQRTGRPARHEALNGLAYAQALAKVELNEALENANRALDLAPDNAAILDTRGYVLHLLGRHEEALADLDAAIQGMDAALDEAGREVAASATASSTDSGLPKTVISLSSSQMQRLSNELRNAAVGHYHRAQALAALGRHEEADSERALVRRLIGREPDETLF